jgi:hypothetical protein
MRKHVNVLAYHDGGGSNEARITRLRAPWTSDRGVEQYASKSQSRHQGTVFNTLVSHALMSDIITEMSSCLEYNIDHF